jgi:tetratricopeptide (TPR) repeat protein
MKRDWEEAIINFNDAIAKDSTNGSFYRSLARCYYDQEKYQRSIDCLEKAVSCLKEPDAQVFFELGLSFFAEK